MPGSSSLWLRSAAWDTCLVAYCWVPFYLWAALGLGLGAEAYGGAPLPRREAGDALALATTVALGCTYVHRHYTMLLVYGDRSAFRQRARAYVLVPLALLALVGGARYASDWELLRIGGSGVTPWQLVLLAAGFWNVWHTVRQRYGIFRVYGKKLGAELGGTMQGTRDQAMLWSSIVIVAMATLWYRPETFASHGNARRVYQTVSPILEQPAALTAIGILVAVAVFAIGKWARHEMSVRLRPSARLPRLSFLFSTFALLAVFVVHGPILGYLCFGVAHALEYLAFVHHYGAGKYGPEGGPGVAAALLGRPWTGAPVLILGLGAIYVVLREFRWSDLYVTYYVGTSLLHFLYDGWIWKVRRPEVAEPLGAAHAPALRPVA